MNIWKFLTFFSSITDTEELPDPACWTGKAARDPKVHGDTAGRMPSTAHVLREEEHGPVCHDCRSPSAGKGLAESTPTTEHLLKSENKMNFLITARFKLRLCSRLFLKRLNVHCKIKVCAMSLCKKLVALLVAFLNIWKVSHPLVQNISGTWIAAVAVLANASPRFCCLHPRVSFPSCSFLLMVLSQPFSHSDFRSFSQFLFFVPRKTV